MSEVIPFNYNNNPIRVVERDDELWFVATDVAEVLGYSKTNAMTRTLDDDEKGAHNLRTLGGEQELSIIRGVLHGTRWAYCWTRISTYIACHWGTHRPQLVLPADADNGTWDERIASLGLRKISLVELPALLRPLGIEVITA